MLRVVFTESTALSLKTNGGHSAPEVGQAVTGRLRRRVPESPARSPRLRTILGNRWMPLTRRRPKAAKPEAKNERTAFLTARTRETSPTWKGIHLAEGGAKAKRAAEPCRVNSFRCHDTNVQESESAATVQDRSGFTAMQSRDAPYRSRRMPASSVAVRGTAPRSDGERTCLELKINFRYKGIQRHGVPHDCHRPDSRPIRQAVPLG